MLLALLLLDCLEELDFFLTRPSEEGRIVAGWRGWAAASTTTYRSLEPEAVRRKDLKPMVQAKESSLGNVEGEKKMECCESLMISRRERMARLLLARSQLQVVMSIEVV